MQWSLTFAQCVSLITKDPGVQDIFTGSQIIISALLLLDPVFKTVQNTEETVKCIQPCSAGANVFTAGVPDGDD